MAATAQPQHIAALATANAKTPTRLITDDHGTRSLYRRCSECGTWKPADTEHFYRDAKSSFGIIGTCQPCKRAQVNANRAAKRAHPESAADLRRRTAAANRRWKQRNPDKVRAARRRRYRRNRTTERELGRIAYRIHRKQQGKPPGRGRPAIVAPYRKPGGRSRSLELAPLQAWLNAVIEREVPEPHRGGNDLADRIGSDFEALAHSLGVNERILWSIRRDRQRTISLAVADRLLTNYGRPVVIRSRDLEAHLVAWAQELPGNGQRLLRYMDRAETLAHIADVSLLRIDDLYPEFDA
jgi:hypothetical protein